MDLVVQAVINGLVSGALLAVPAIGFTAMFAVLRFPNFSVSGIATLGAFGFEGRWDYSAIGGVVNVPAVVEYAKTLPDVAYVENNLYTCSNDTQELIKQKIAKLGENIQVARFVRMKVGGEVQMETEPSAATPVETK